jgi:hypothetical protein
MTQAHNICVFGLGICMDLKDGKIKGRYERDRVCDRDEDGKDLMLALSFD